MEGLKQNYQKIISLKKAKKLVILLVFIFLFDFFLFAMPALASEAVEEANINQEQLNIVNHLPQNNDTQLEIKSISYHTATAYNSEPGQTDDTPCITANRFNLCEHGVEDTVAANFLPFGAKIRIPDIYGDKVFIVRDRMNSRYQSRVDIWMLEKADAINFGVQTVKIEILE